MPNHVCNIRIFSLRDEFTTAAVVAFLIRKLKYLAESTKAKLQGQEQQFRGQRALNLQQHKTGSLNTALLGAFSISHQPVNAGKMHALL